MALYMDEEQVWKCPKHPSKRRRTGICPKCLRDRLVTLCPDCAAARPCACSPPPVDHSSSSSSSSASFSLFSFSRGGSRHDFVSSSAVANGEACRLPNNLETDPALRRSRSSAIPFLRSRSKYVGGGSAGGGCKVVAVVENDNKPTPKVSRSKINFWSVFTPNKSKKCDVHGDSMDEDSNKSDEMTALDDYSTMMRSRSVAVGAGAGAVAGNGFAPAGSKQKGWYFPSPIKAFRHSKPPRSVAVA